jgi:tetratricopeptide (TPR) repeat protein
MDITKEERAALVPVQQAVKAQDWQAGVAALPAAVRAAHSPDALYAIGHFELEIGLGRNDAAMQARGLDHLLASKRVPAADLPVIYRNRGVLANNAGDKRAAEAAFAKVVELQPQNPEALISLAQVKVDLKQPLESVRLIERAIGLKRSAGASVDETWYKYALKISYDGRSDPALRRSALGLSRDLVTAYPTQANWRDALIILRDAGGLDPAGQLDVLRLMRASGALAGERDWYDLADGLLKAGNVAGAKAVLDEGATKGAINPKKEAFAELIRAANDRLAGNRDVLAADEAKAMAAANGALALQVGDAWSGYGDQAKAIALYRAALGKSGVDSQEVKAHLAMALLASGDRAGAEAMFKSLTGPRKELGAYWVLWLHKS